MYNLMIGHVLRKVRSLYEDGQREIFILHQNSFIFEEAIRECNGAFFFFLIAVSLLDDVVLVSALTMV